MNKHSSTFGSVVLAILLIGGLSIAARASTMRASESGAHLNTDLMKGGGADDTPIIQKLLDRAKSGESIHVIVDGAALVSGLDLYSNTLFECTPGGGLYLKDHSSRAILRNAHRSRGHALDEKIEVRGCFLNGNRSNQSSAEIQRADLPLFPFPSNKEKDGTYISGIQFLGVNYIKLLDVTLWNVRAFGALIANASYVDIQNIYIDHGGGENANDTDYGNTDGLHFKGPLRYVTVNQAKFRVGDDAIAISPNDYETDDVTARNDFGPFVGQGAIMDVNINNVTFLPGQLNGIRVLSTNERVDHVAIRNLFGSVRYRLFDFGHWLNKKSFGSIGSITIENVNVGRQSTPSSIRDSSKWEPPALLKLYSTDCQILIDDRIDSLSIRHLATNSYNYEAVFSIGTKANVGTFDVDIIDLSPLRVSPTFDLKSGSRIDYLRVALDWHGKKAEGIRPLTGDVASVNYIQWINTPPNFVSVKIATGNSLYVTFSQRIRATDFRSGVKVKVNGKDVNLLKASLFTDRSTIRYEIKPSLRSGDAVSWSYNAAVGSLQNFNGDVIESVADSVAIVP
jgi:hypothetical protein